MDINMWSWEDLQELADNTIHMMHMRGSSTPFIKVIAATRYADTNDRGVMLTIRGRDEHMDELVAPSYTIAITQEDVTIYQRDAYYGIYTALAALNIPIRYETFCRLRGAWMRVGLGKDHAIEMYRAHKEVFLDGQAVPAAR